MSKIGATTPHGDSPIYCAAMRGGGTPRYICGMSRPLILTALALCIANLAAEIASLHWLVYVLKPLATGALALLAARAPQAGAYRTWITRGLLLSLAGDVLLMLPLGLFVPGLLAFLAAHLCYIAALAGDGGGVRAPWLPAIPVFAIAAGVLAALWPSLGSLRLPVAAYVGVIATMAWQAIARWRVLRTQGALLAAAGACCFLMSDASLAMRRFVAPFAGATMLIMLTYYAAQWGLALSVHDGERPA